MKDKGDSISCLFFAELLWRGISHGEEAELCYMGLETMWGALACYKASDGSVQHGSKISPTSGFGSRWISSLGDEIILSFPLPRRLAESKGASYVHELRVKNTVEKNLSEPSCAPQIPSTIQFAHPIPGGFVLLVVGIILGWSVWWQLFGYFSE